ncbi:hypothetical protein [Rhodoferax sp. GW822-FHT02A01]|uniref:hypothetical protein n=1 Tax=Rhodoferax sp. GW822-FHT02A01 TaxID=3141537 RepID=UPI00315DD6C6
MQYIEAVRTMQAKLSVVNRIMLLCGIALIIIWPIEGTLALRNLLLFVGGALGLKQTVQHSDLLRGPSARPIQLITALGLWVIFHYLVLSQNSPRELYHLKHSWLPGAFAAFLGIGTGLVAGSNSRWRKGIFFGLLAFLLFFYANYFQISYSLGRFTMPYPWEMGYYGNKISIVVFGMLSLAITLSMLSQTFQILDKGNTLRSLGIALLLVLNLLAFLLVGTKNGMALGTIVLGCFVLIELVARRKNWKVIAILSGIIVTGVTILYVHTKSINEWDNFSATVTAGFQTDKYDNWSNHEAMGPPVLADGTVTKDSAYVRTAYAVLGAQFLLEKPLGYGSLNDSFKYLVKEKYPEKKDTTVVATLSGWLDFGLAMGLPGLLLLLAAVGSTYYLAWGQSTLWSKSTMWLMATLALAWLVAEVCDDIFLESLLFFVCLFSAGNISHPKMGKSL